MIQQLAALYGIGSIEVMVPLRPVRGIMGFVYTTTADDPVCVPCSIVEDVYKVSDGYKVTLKAHDPNYGWEHYYQSDLDSLIREGHAQVRVQMHSDV